MKAELVELARRGEIDALETRCLEQLEGGTLRLGDLAAALEHVQERAPQRAAALAQMVAENLPSVAEPEAALRVVRQALVANPQAEELRRQCAELYRRLYGGRPAFQALLNASGLLSGRAPRMALRTLDTCLPLAVGDALVHRGEGQVAEVVEIDPNHGLFTIRRGSRTSTLPAAELAAEYDRADPDDLRVLRQLRPERIAAMIAEDPARLILGLLRAHGGVVDLDVIRHELSPRYIPAAEWPGWWNRPRALLRRMPQVAIEGRSPTLLRLVREAPALEDQTWAAIEAARSPREALRAAETYLREKKVRGEAPDEPLVARILAQTEQRAAALRTRRPSEALGWLLAGQIIEQLAGRPTRHLAAELLRAAPDPLELVRRLDEDDLWGPALDELAQAFPEDWPRLAVALLPQAPAQVLDGLARAAIQGAQDEALRSAIEAALRDPLSSPEVIYWLWKGPEVPVPGAPHPLDLLGRILETLHGIGRTSRAGPREKAFRQRARDALLLRDAARLRECLAAMDPSRAVTVRHQLERSEGLGQSTRARLLQMLREHHPQLWASTPTPRQQPWEDPDVLWTTAEGLRRRTEQRDHLLNVTMRENEKRIGEAAAHGDLSENSEYKFALEERDLLRARLAQMNQELSLARVLGPHDVPSDHIGVGSRVLLRDTATGQEHTLTFLGPFDADLDRNIYNYKAPLAQKLMGRRVGDRVRLHLAGRESDFEVVRIESAI